MLKILKKTSGASLMFVLSAMMLLMAIGTSALVAASVSAGAGVNQNIYNQLNMHCDSVQKSIMYGLQVNDDVYVRKLIWDENSPTTNQAKTLGEQMLRAIYLSEEPSALLPLPDKLTLALDSQVLPVTSIDIRLEFTPIREGGKMADITDFQYPEYDSYTDYDDETGEFYDVEYMSSPAAVKTASINAYMTVTTTIEMGSKKIRYKTLYLIDDAELTGGSTLPLNNAATDDDGKMTIVRPGTWRMVSNERTDV